MSNYSYVVAGMSARPYEFAIDVCQWLTTVIAYCCRECLFVPRQLAWFWHGSWRKIFCSLRSHGARLSLALQTKPRLGQGRARVVACKFCRYLWYLHAIFADICGIFMRILPISAIFVHGIDRCLCRYVPGIDNCLHRNAYSIWCNVCWTR